MLNVYAEKRIMRMCECISTKYTQLGSVPRCPPDCRNGSPSDGVRIDRDGSGDITIEDILGFLKEAGSSPSLRLIAEGLVTAGLLAMRLDTRTVLKLSCLPRFQKGACV